MSCSRSSKILRCRSGSRSLKAWSRSGVRVWKRWLRSSLPCRARVRNLQPHVNIWYGSDQNFRYPS